MEKRILLAFLLSALFLAWYGRQVSRWTGADTPSSPASRDVLVEPLAPPEEPPAAVLRPLGKEPVVLLESASLQLEVGQTTGALRRLVLQDFQETGNHDALRFGGDLPLVSFEVSNAPLQGRLVGQTSRSARIQAQDVLGNDYHISYEIEDDRVAQISIRAANQTQLPENTELAVTTSWSRSDELGGRYNALELFVVTRTDEQLKHKRYHAPFRTIKDVPRGTSWVSLTERYFCQSVKFGYDASAIRLLPSPEDTIASQVRFPLSVLQDSPKGQQLTVYAGPRDYFYLKEAGFAGAFPIGILGQIGLALLVVLSAISNLVHNYGLGIIIFAAAITGAMAPFTIMSYRSMKKMQELKPEMDRLMAKYKQDPQRMQREVFALYKQHRVSPLSGCLPMMLQLPIFIALFQAISHYIELRGQGFLWIQDLSLPDRLVQLPFSLPLIGSDLNALPIIMAAAMFVQSRISQGQMGATQSNPMAKVMSGPVMPLVFCLMFYQFPAGLVLYWLTNTAMSLLWYRLAH